MRKSVKVERYLSQVERELADMPSDERARVLKDVKAQIKKELAKGKTATEVLRDLGAPKLIAMSHAKVRCREAKTSPWVRWTAMSTVALFALILAGGLGWILRHAQSVRPTGALEANPVRALVGGSFPLAGKTVKSLRVNFNVGKLTLENAPGVDASWVCAGEPRVSLDDQVLTFAPDQDVASCEIAVPAELETSVAAVNGHLDVRQPHYPLDVQLANGRVSIAPDPARIYDFDVHVKNGLQDFFRRSPAPRATKVRIIVVNGTVKKE